MTKAETLRHYQYEAEQARAELVLERLTELAASTRVKLKRDPVTGVFEMASIEQIVKLGAHA